MLRRVLLSLAGVLLLAIPAARAQDNTSALPAIDNTSAVSGRGFGSGHTLVVTGEANSDLGYLNVHGESGFRFNLSPSMDFFIQDHFSVGGALSFRVLSFSDHTAVSFGMEPRFGYEFRINPNISLWPRGGVEFDTSSPEFYTDVVADTGGGVIFGFDADMPILYHVADHFFLGGGPAIHTEFTGDIKSNFIGARFYVGGWM